MNVMIATPVMLKVVNAINEGVFVIHRIWISVEVRIAHQVKLSSNHRTAHFKTWS